MAAISAAAAVLAIGGLAAAAPAASAASPLARHHHARIVKSLTKAEERKATRIIEAMDRQVMAADRRHSMRENGVRPFNVGTTNFYAGYGDFQASSGVTFLWQQGNYRVPTVNCATITYYQNLPAYIFTWYGISAGGFVAQAGSLVVCNNNHTLQGVNDWYTIQPGDSVFYSDLNTAMGDSMSAVVCAPGTAFNTAPCYDNLQHASDYIFALTDNTSGQNWTNYLVCPPGTTCSNQDTDAYMEQPTGYDAAAFTYPGGAGFSGVEVKSNDGTVGSLTSVSGEWTSQSTSIENSNGRVLVAPGTLSNTYPPTGDSFSPVFKACC